jgi:hypothetical protein
MRLSLRSKKNWVLEFQRCFRVALQPREVHNKGFFDSENRVIFKKWISTIKDLSSDWFVPLSLHLLKLAGVQLKSG